MPLSVGSRIVPPSLPSAGPIEGDWLRLDPLTEADIEALFPILADPEVYAHGYVMHRPPATLAEASDLVRRRFLNGQGELDGKGAGRNAYAVRAKEDCVLGEAGTFIGTTSLMQADLWNESIHLGSTLYGSRWWGTVVNPEAKYLLLKHCFDDCGYGRVKIQTDVLNVRSAAAISRLGAVREGVIRRDQRRDDGTFRDTVVFSVLSDEWPRVRERLTERLSAPRA